VKERVGAMLQSIRMGDVTDFTNFVNAVIDEASFNNIMDYINYAKQSPDATVFFGGNGDKTEGYYIEPTVIVTTDPAFKTMTEEIFGPVITIYVYDESQYEETLALCDRTSPYGLTGSIFARDRYAIDKAFKLLRYSAGNFYINDKPTGAVIAQQPFGGSRASGTNDKAGGPLNLVRWTNPRTIKETYVSPTHYGYPFLGEK
jgi:1-pyrroline-5-carboxylate dehydrogenase